MYRKFIQKIIDNHKGIDAAIGKGYLALLQDTLVNELDTIKLLDILVEIEEWPHGAAPSIVFYSDGSGHININGMEDDDTTKQVHFSTLIQLVSDWKEIDKEKLRQEIETGPKHFNSRGKSL